MTDLLQTLRCSLKHAADWMITYDIGQDKSEKMIVCNECYFNPIDSSFRSFVISKSHIEEPNTLD